MSTLIEDAEDVRAMEQKAVKERPILFSGAMVRAILSGQKTQTRRVVNPYPPAQRTVIPYLPSAIVPQQGGTFAAYTDGRKFKEFTCPYGQPGDRLWVREAFHAYHWDRPRAVYRADGERQRVRTQIESYEVGRWKPSIHMPRWACRIVLEIVSVRVERLQDISETDAMAEGWERRQEVSSDPEVHTDAARDWFSDLWSSINGPESWSANSWVWVVEFKKVAA